MQIFHAIWLIDADGRIRIPSTLVSVEDVESGRWRMNAAVARALSFEPD